MPLAAKQSQGLLLAHQHCHDHPVADLLLLTPRGFGVFQELHSWSCCLPKGLQPQAEVAQEQVGKHSCRLSTCLRCPYISGTESARLQPHTCFYCAKAGAGPLPAAPGASIRLPLPPQARVWHCCSWRAQGNPHGVLGT